MAGRAALLFFSNHCSSSQAMPRIHELKSISLWYATDLGSWRRHLEKDRTQEIKRTLLASPLSARLAITKITRYNTKVNITVTRTVKFCVSSSFRNETDTSLKSIGLGATNKLPPNAVRWLQEHCRKFSRVVEAT